ncbi:MarR family winged helix-turn-helix transcriptional regulator [Kutzneria sp. CA-103260]|uniref:MarR family winged helix-turn-helix transcriptional regulator n=1 Tax=Kutzneria sp. CA-103260 TaxID=2802641 RepID=UPI001BA8B780|nr:MarR family transcriptional regulator [Kutzneria sp. CA-103260]QUQ67602.1 MarR family transcriptional regulator [Kutzneria sp. CA-103260]
MPRTPGELAENTEVDAVTDAVLAAARLLMAVTARSIAAVDESITLAQFRLLVILNTVGAVKHAALADQLGVNPSTASRMVDRLVSAGMVDRQANPASRREIVIELTAEGRRVVRQVTARRRQEIAAIVARMPEPTRAGLVDALLAFAEAGGEPAVIDTGWA